MSIDSYFEKLSAIRMFDDFYIAIKNMDYNSLQDKVAEECEIDYEFVWLPYIKQLQSLVLDGERNLSRVIQKIQQEQTLKYSKFLNEAMFLGHMLKVPNALITPWRDALTSTKLMQHCPADSECVIEFGAGHGLNLFKLWLAGGPLNVDYHSCEITISGRLFSLMLSKLAAEIHFNVNYFDYTKPDMSFIKKKYASAFCFTRGSIEQIPHLSVTFFKKILDSFKRVKVVHLEPVGWQMVEEKDHDFLIAIHKKRCETKYNKNLINLLEGLEKKNQLE